MDKQAKLDVAAFMDSGAAAALVDVEREGVRRIASELVFASYRQLGKKPSLLDGQDLRGLLLEHLPGTLAPKDPLAVHVPDILAAFLNHLDESEVPAYAFELRNALHDAAPEFLEIVRSGKSVGRTSALPQETFVHHASRLGRNDPCSCGSGKKYKKCHGRNE